VRVCVCVRMCVCVRERKREYIQMHALQSLSTLSLALPIAVAENVFALLAICCSIARTCSFLDNLSDLDDHHYPMCFCVFVCVRAMFLTYVCVTEHVCTEGSHTCVGEHA